LDPEFEKADDLSEEVKNFSINLECTRMLIKYMNQFGKLIAKKMHEEEQQEKRLAQQRIETEKLEAQKAEEERLKIKEEKELKRIQKYLNRRKVIGNLTKKLISEQF
jgi:hypothetical protein